MNKAHRRLGRTPLTLSSPTLVVFLPQSSVSHSVSSHSASSLSSSCHQAISSDSAALHSPSAHPPSSSFFRRAQSLTRSALTRPAHSRRLVIRPSAQ
ncbi:hypothetical protein TorRG33x02_182310, partial [Trema orientale]